MKSFDLFVPSSWIPAEWHANQIKMATMPLHDHLLIHPLHWSKPMEFIQFVQKILSMLALVVHQTESVECWFVGCVYCELCCNSWFVRSRCTMLFCASCSVETKWIVYLLILQNKNKPKQNQLRTGNTLYWNHYHHLLISTPRLSGCSCPSTRLE